MPCRGRTAGRGRRHGIVTHIIPREWNRSLTSGKEPSVGEDGIIAFPGGDAIQAGGGNTLVVTWPCGSFVARVAYWEGSHITVGFAPDPDMTYDGLVRFTERYMVPRRSRRSTILSPRRSAKRTSRTRSFRRKMNRRKPDEQVVPGSCQQAVNREHAEGLLHSARTAVRFGLKWSPYAVRAREAEAQPASSPLALT